MLLSLLLVAVVVQLQHVDAHGMVLDPVCRQSRWRYNRTAPADYNDNQVFCGGFWVSLSLSRATSSLVLRVRCIRKIFKS